MKVSTRLGVALFGLAGVLTCTAGLLWGVDKAANTKVAVKNSSDWPEWRGPSRNNQSTETGLLKDWDKTPPQLLWEAEGMGKGYASLSIANGKIYTSGNGADGQAVVCLDLNGKVLWTSKFTEHNPDHSYDGSRTTPTIDGDRLYVVASSGNITCMKTADGTIVWQRDFLKDFGGKLMSGWGFSESPLVDGDMVVCTPGGDEAMMVAFNKMTGKVIWKSAMLPFSKKGKEGAGYSSIVVSEGAGVKQYIQLVGRGVIGVRAKDGKMLWGYDGVTNDVANIPTPLVQGDFVFASTGYGAGAALLELKKKGTGVEAVEKYFLPANDLQNHHGGMILKDGYVYCGHRHNEGFPICVEMKTGKTIWGGDVRPVGKGSAATTYADGNIIFRYQSGPVALVEATPEGYKLKGSFTPKHASEPCWSHPVVHGGKLYLRDQDKLMCYNLKP